MEQSACGSRARAVGNDAAEPVSPLRSLSIFNRGGKVIRFSAMPRGKVALTEQATLTHAVG